MVTTHAEMAIVVMMRFLSQIAMLYTGGIIKLDMADIHVGLTCAGQ